jgi:hypothetical protein
MSFDVETAPLVAGGEVVPLKPVELEGLHASPPIATRSSQAAGAGATVLVAKRLGGRARVFGHVRDFQAAENTVISQNNYLTLGQAVWFALVVVQHRNAGAVSLLWVPGTVAAVASAAKPTLAQIKTFLDLDDGEATLGICGDIRFHRSADTVIDVMTTPKRRPAYTDDSQKTSYEADAATKSSLVLEPRGFVDFHANLVSLSAVTPGNLAIDGSDLPAFPYGGKITKFQYLQGQAPTGAGASIQLALQFDGVLVAGSQLALTLANTALGQPPVEATPSSAFDFLGHELDLEVDTVTTAFTGGAGTLRVYVSEYVPA